MIAAVVQCQMREKGNSWDKSNMTKREVIRMVLEHRRPPYVPWSFSFTYEAMQKLTAHYGRDRLDDVLAPHLLGLGSGIGFFEDLGGDRFRDVFGVVWDRTVDKRWTASTPSSPR
jgi:uroporphyrinogen decarboxylase